MENITISLFQYQNRKISTKVIVGLYINNMKYLTNKHSLKGMGKVNENKIT